MYHLLHWRRRAVSFAAAVALGLVFVGQTLARTAPSAGIAACVSIASDQARLACYDRASGRAALPAAPSAVPEPLGRTAMSAPAPPLVAEPKAAESLIDSAWGFDPDSDRYIISLYRPNYIQLASYSARPNEEPFRVLFDALEYPNAGVDPVEVQFQLSFKTRLWATEDRRFGVWAAYTQQSQWQVYNTDVSSPFRETNYQPELLVSYSPDISFKGFHWRLFNFGYNHQSNGRADPISRSWDRLIAELGIEQGDFALLVRPWVIIDEGGDDNPDIADYMGWGDITAVYKWRGNSFTLMGRGNPGTKKGAAKLTWTSPPILGPLRGYVSAFTGYGESLIDYDWKQNTFGIGVTLNDLLDRPGERR